jgi:hypothetical protein
VGARRHHHPGTDATGNRLEPDEQNTMFHPSEVELVPTTKLILADVERLRPTCVVCDSLSEFRLLAGSALRYRRQILALKQCFATRECTVILLDDLTAIDRDLQVQSIAHGVVLLEQLNPEYGSERRRLRVVKYQGVKFRGGYHVSPLWSVESWEGRDDGRPVLAAAWGFMCGLAYYSFFGHLQRLSEADPSGLSPLWVVAVKGVGLALGIAGLITALRPLPGVSDQLNR